MSDETVTINTKGLDQLVKALKGSLPTARIGILGSDSRSGGGPSNATVGAAHEFGTTKLPQRSFLRIPISENLDKEITNSGALDKDVLADVVKKGTIVPWLKKITIIAESIVAEAFSTSGFGKWIPSNMQFKKNQQTLVETQQLRDSITSEVVE